jgi:hypothetical protein
MQSVELVYLLKIIVKVVIQLNESFLSMVLLVHVYVMMVYNSLRLYMVYVFLKIQMDQFVAMATSKQANNVMILI